MSASKHVLQVFQCLDENRNQYAGVGAREPLNTLPFEWSSRSPEFYMEQLYLIITVPTLSLVTNKRGRKPERADWFTMAHVGKQVEC